MATDAQINANRRNAQKSTGPKTPEGKARSRRNRLQHGLTAQTCMLEDEDPADLLELLGELREKFDPQDTDEDFLLERMAKARFRYERIMPLEAAIYNLRLAVDKAPAPLVEAQGISAQRAWAYMRDANGGNALSKLSRYETSLLREYDRSRQELDKLQKIRSAKRNEPNPPGRPNQPGDSYPSPLSTSEARPTVAGLSHFYDRMLLKAHNITLEAGLHIQPRALLDPRGFAMALARITGQGLTSIAVLVILLWACVIGERIIVSQANAQTAEAVRAIRSLQLKNRRQPAAAPLHPPLKRQRPELG
jgi:hypothetical protein